MLIGERVTIYYNRKIKSIEGVGVITKVYQQVLENVYQVELQFENGILKDQLHTRMACVEDIV